MSDTDPASFYDFRQYRLARARDGSPGEIEIADLYDNTRRFIAIDGRAFRVSIIDLQPSSAVDSLTERRIGLFLKLQGEISATSPVVPIIDRGRDDDDFYVIKAARDAESLASYLTRVGTLPEVAAAQLVSKWLDAINETPSMMDLIGGFRPDRLLIHNGSLLFEDYTTPPAENTDESSFLSSVEWLIQSLVSGEIYGSLQRTPQSASIASLHTALKKIIGKAADTQAGQAQLTASLPPHRRPIREWLVSGTPLIDQNFLPFNPWEIQGPKAKAIKANGNSFSLAPSDDILPHLLPPRQHGKGVLRREPLPAPAVPHGSTSRCGNGRLVGESFPDGEWQSLAEIAQKDDARAAIQKIARVVSACEQLEDSSFPIWWIPATHAFFNTDVETPLIRTYFSMTSLMQGMQVPEAMLDRMHRADRDGENDELRNYRRSVLTMGLINEVPAFSSENAQALPPELAEFLEKARVSPDSFPVVEGGQLLEAVQTKLGLPPTREPAPEPEPKETSVAASIKAGKESEKPQGFGFLKKAALGAAALVVCAIVGLALFTRDSSPVMEPDSRVIAEAPSEPGPVVEAEPIETEPEPAEAEPEQTPEEIVVNETPPSEISAPKAEITEEIATTSEESSPPITPIEEPPLPIQSDAIDSRAATLAYSATQPGKKALEEGRIIGAIDEHLSSIAALDEVETALGSELDAIMIKWRDSGIPIDSPEKIERIAAASSHSAIAAEVMAEHYREAGDETEARRWTERAAQVGSAKSMAEHGRNSIAHGGMEEAAAWFKKGADLGDPECQLLYGECLLLGKGTETNRELAVDYLTNSVNAGNGQAMDLLGICFSRGWGVEKSSERAAELFQAAVDAGNDAALYNLAARYLSGDGVEKDLEKATELLRQSAKLGNKHAAEWCTANGITF